MLETTLETGLGIHFFFSKKRIKQTLQDHQRRRRPRRQGGSRCSIAVRVGDSVSSANVVSSCGWREIWGKHRVSIAKEPTGQAQPSQTISAKRGTQPTTLASTKKTVAEKAFMENISAHKPSTRTRQRIVRRRFVRPCTYLAGSPQWCRNPRMIFSSCYRSRYGTRQRCW